MTNYIDGNKVLACHVLDKVVVTFKKRKVPAGTETTMCWLLIGGPCKGVSGQYSMN